MDLAAFGAHPDDVEICCGGLLLKAARQGYRTAVVDLTAGELATAGDPATRGREAAEAASILGLAERRCLGLPDGGLTHTERGQREAVVKEIRRLRPRVVLVPFPRCSHPDHVEAGLLLEECIHLARVARWGAGGEAWRAAGILYYESRIPLVPTLLVDVSEVADEKRRAIGCYQSQFGGTGEKAEITELQDPAFLERFELRSRWLGSLLGVSYAEPYLTRSPLPVGDPVSLFAVCPGPRGGIIGA